MRLQKVADILTKFNRPLVAFVKYVALWILAMMMFLTFADVLLRYIFNSPVPGATELIEFMMGIVVTFSVAYTAHEKSHIGVDLLVMKLKERTRKMIGVFTNFLTLGLFILICWQTYILMTEDYHSKIISAVLYIPVYPFIATVTVGFVILCLVLLAEFFGLLGEVISEWTR
ncbi:MAG: TRAP transporter small permease [Desulfobacteraceae bacterium]|nr:TRAP transporter small permease [Desulfobacteraceae bacterium]